MYRSALLVVICSIISACLEATECEDCTFQVDESIACVNELLRKIEPVNLKNVAPCHDCDIYGIHDFKRTKDRQVCSKRTGTDGVQHEFHVTFTNVTTRCFCDLPTDVDLLLANAATTSAQYNLEQCPVDKQADAVSSMVNAGLPPLKPDEVMSLSECQSAKKGTTNSDTKKINTDLNVSGGGSISFGTGSGVSIKGQANISNGNNNSSKIDTSNDNGKDKGNNNANGNGNGKGNNGNGNNNGNNGNGKSNGNNGNGNNGNGKGNGNNGNGNGNGNNGKGKGNGNNGNGKGNGNNGNGNNGNGNNGNGNNGNGKSNGNNGNNANGNSNGNYIGQDEWDNNSGELSDAGVRVQRQVVVVVSNQAPKKTKVSTQSKSVQGYVNAQWLGPQITFTSTTQRNSNKVSISHITLVTKNYDNVKVSCEGDEQFNSMCGCLAAGKFHVYIMVQALHLILPCRVDDESQKQHDIVDYFTCVD